MDHQILWVITGICASTLAGVFWKMQGGFGPNNLKAVGIVLIAFLACVLSVGRADGFNAAVGLLGAVAGYLFGIKTKKAEEKAPSGGDVGVNASGASFGHSAKIAYGDINDTINNLYGQVQELEKLIDRASATTISLNERLPQSGRTDYLINTIYERQFKDMRTAFNRVISVREAEGWKFVNLSSDYQGMDGIFLLFERQSNGLQPEVFLYHGTSMSNVQ